MNLFGWFQAAAAGSGADPSAVAGAGLIPAVVQLGAAGGSIFVMVYFLRFGQDAIKLMFEQLDRLQARYAAEQAASRDIQRAGMDQVRGLFDDLRGEIARFRSEREEIVGRFAATLAALEHEVHEIRDRRQAEGR